MTSRGQCPRGGGACGYLCKISGKATPLPPLTKAFPYAYGCVYVCMYVCMYVRTYVCMYVCRPMYVCVYVYMYVCMAYQFFECLNEYMLFCYLCHFRLRYRGIFIKHLRNIVPMLYFFLNDDIIFGIVCA